VEQAQAYANGVAPSNKFWNSDSKLDKIKEGVTNKCPFRELFLKKESCRENTRMIDKIV